MKNLRLLFGECSSHSTIELNWPYLRLLFFLYRYNRSFVHSHLSRFPYRNRKYINEHDFLFFFFLSAGYIEDLVQARPDQQRLLDLMPRIILRYEGAAYIYARAEAL